MLVFGLGDVNRGILEGEACRDDEDSTEGLMGVGVSLDASADGLTGDAGSVSCLELLSFMFSASARNASKGVEGTKGVEGVPAVERGF